MNFSSTFGNFFALNLVKTKEKQIETLKATSNSIKLWLENLDFPGILINVLTVYDFFYNLLAWIYGCSPQ